MACRPMLKVQTAPHKLKFQGEVTPWLGRVIQKPVNANLGLKVYQSIFLQMMFFTSFFSLKLKTEGQIIKTENHTEKL